MCRKLSTWFEPVDLGKEEQMHREDLYKREVVTVGATDSVLHAARLMREAHVGDVIVLEQNKPVGILTDRDIVVSVVAEGVGYEKLAVRDVMTGELVTGSENGGAEEWITLMRVRGIRRLPIVDEKGTLQGLVTVDDLIKALATELAALSRVSLHQQQIERETRAPHR